MRADMSGELLSSGETDLNLSSLGFLWTLSIYSANGGFPLIGIFCPLPQVLIHFGSTEAAMGRLL